MIEIDRSLPLQNKAELLLLAQWSIKSWSLQWENFHMNGYTRLVHQEVIIIIIIIMYQASESSVQEYYSKGMDYAQGIQ